MKKKGNIFLLFLLPLLVNEENVDSFTEL